MTNTTKLVACFNNCIDNDNYQFTNRKEAIALVESLTTNKVGKFEWSDSSKEYPNEVPYRYLSFTEYVEIEINDNGQPLYTQIDKNISGQIQDGVYSSVKRAK